MKIASSDLKDLLKKESNLLKEVFNAPFIKIRSNMDNGESANF